MKIKNLVLAVFLSVSTLSAQSQDSSYIAPLATKSLLVDIVAENDRLIAVGERGHLLISNDAGDSWEQKSIPTVSMLTAVVSLGDNIWAVGHDSVIVSSDDGGDTWSRQQYLPEIQRPLLDVLFFDQSHGVAIGAYGAFFRTQDGGESWAREYHVSLLDPYDQEYLEELKEEDEAFYQQELAAIMPHLNRITQEGEQLFLAGESGLLAYSDDKGLSWQRLEPGYMGSFFDITLLDNGGILAAGLRGNLYESDASFENWQNVKTGTTATFNSIVKLNNQKYLMVGNNGTLLWYGEDEKRLQKLKHGKSVLNAVAANGNITAVTAVGIKSLSQ
ncbi:MAG: WD40/YVTN/BNR-like repeat-containing protein [Aestuariibacter sp.]